MASYNKQEKCGICSVGVAAGVGQAIFTGECSHAFHFPCINTYLSNGNRICPVCSVRWNNLPSVPPSNPLAFSSRSPLPSSYRAQKRPRYTPRSTPRSTLKRFGAFNSVSEPEPLCFNDDEPLSLPAVDDKSKDSFPEWQKVTIKAIPECRAVAASESVSSR